MSRFFSFFSTVHLKIICLLLFTLKTLIYISCLTVYTSSYLSPLLWPLISVTTKSVTVSKTLTKTYSSLDSLIALSSLSMNWKFTFLLSNWHLPNVLSFSLLPFPVNTIYLHLQILLSSHVFSFTKFLTDACTRQSMSLHLSVLQILFSEVRIPAFLTG